MSRATTLPESWATLARVLGGVAALADACGVTPRTLARWATGELRPTALRLADVRTRLRRRGLVLPALPQTEEREREP